MKRTFAYIFSLLLLLVGTSQLSFAQKDGKGSRAGNWFLGLNAGGAWNQSDVCIEPGGGLGFYVGKNIWYSPAISLDLRGRYLWTQTHGQNGERSFLNGADSLTFTNRLMRGEIADPNNYNLFDPNNPLRNYSSTGFVYHNYKTNFHNLSLELRANIEAVYPVWLSFYAGADLGIYRSKTNQFGEDLFGTATTYNSLYEGLDPNLSESDAKFDIWAGSDDTYETFSAGDDKWSAGFMPSVGWELGYWFTPRLALGIGHRATFTLRDDFEGVEIAQPKGIKTDIHHYGGLFFSWRVQGATEKPEPEPVIISLPPVVEFTQPSSSGTTVATSTTTVMATVQNVTDKNSVLFTINGTPTRNFSYNPNTDVFQATVTLQQGSNTLIVTGSNKDGRASDETVINYQEIKCDAPIINITNPRGSPTLSTATTTISANLQYVARSQDITVNISGTPVPNFTFDGTTLTAQVNLSQGSNTISISAKNECGSDIESFVIRYKPAEIIKNPPTVTITNPTINPYNSPSKTTVVTATITNVPNKNGVTFTINGNNTNNFSYSNGSFVASGITLNQGSNTFTIKGTNADGSDTKSTVIIYTPVVIKNPPVVTITQPNSNPYTSPTATTTIRANITNVPTKSGVTFTINGTQTSNFSYNGNTLVASGITLSQGNNVFTVTGTNADGSDTKSTVIVYNPVVVKNPPVVTITQPNTSPYTVQTATTTLTANITNVPTKSGVTFTINGTQTGNFSYNGSTLVASGISLNPGTNVFTVTGTNADGSDTKSTIIVYEPILNPPVVTITQPNTNPYQSPTQTTTLTANITNVPTKSGVTFTINGTQTGNFSYNG
ncbi:MAG: hypothetical protein MK212_16630, partial [Saprospiraceae bacterium]|nr:hypothetical protein [Saprospiraceae bacterium]